MCLITSDPTILIAEEDIIVFKLLQPKLIKQKNGKYLPSSDIFTGGYYSNIKGFSYRVGEVHKHPKPLKKPDHSAKDWKTFKASHMDSRVLSVYSNNRNLHAFTHVFHAFLPTRFESPQEIRWYEFLPLEKFMYECIIPKGSKYVIDETGLIGSDTIKIIKRLFSHD